MSQRRLQAPDNLTHSSSSHTDRFDLGLLVLVGAWFLLALAGPFAAGLLVWQIGLRWTLYALLAAVVGGAAFVMFSPARRGGATASSRLVAALAAFAGLPVMGAGLLVYVASAVILGFVFWATVLGFPRD
jgi:hypothetical protein